MAETNLTKQGDLAKAHSIDFVRLFTGGITKLMEALGTTRKLPLSAGVKIKTYKATVDLKDGNVAEGALIPLSKVTAEPDKEYEVPFKKWRKSTSAEAIQQYGMTQAVADTDDKLLREIQKGMRQSFFDFLATGTATAIGVGLQGALAQAWGTVQTLFEDDGVNTLCFVNPLDVADYIGGANITTQTAFGMTFITGFTGVTIITNTNVPQGKIFATAPDNVVLAYVPVTGSEMAKAFSFTTDETGYVGITHDKINNNMTYESVLVSPILLFAERLDGVVVVTIDNSGA